MRTFDDLSALKADTLLSRLHFHQAAVASKVNFPNAGVVKGFHNVLVVFYLNQTVAEHPRIWGREQVRFDPMHYLAVLEKKPGAWDHARPLRGWKLPECFEVLRRSLALWTLSTIGWGRNNTPDQKALLSFFTHKKSDGKWAAEYNEIHKREKTIRDAYVKLGLE